MLKSIEFLSFQHPSTTVHVVSLSHSASVKQYFILFMFTLITNLAFNKPAQ